MSALKKRLTNKNNLVEHIDITQFNPQKVMDGFGHMSFTARETYLAAELYLKMLRHKKCKIFLAIAGSATAGGCMDIPVKLVENNMVDAIIATGATVVDMDFFEALGFRHYQLKEAVDDEKLRRLGLDRIYDTLIQEADLQVCDQRIKKIADKMTPGSYASCEFIAAMGAHLHRGNAQKRHSLVETCYLKGVPIFSPAFSDSSAGFGLTAHQEGREKEGRPYTTIDSVRDFRLLTKLVIKAHENGGSTGLFMIGGGSPKNFIQDTVVCADIMGHPIGMHEYAVQITVADVRDGACSSSTLKEANSWGKVKQHQSQMVYDEATKSWPLIASYAYHQREWSKERPETNFNAYLKTLPKGR